MPLTLAGVPLILPTRQLLDAVERTVPVEHACPWGVRAWPGPGLAQVAFPRAARMPADLKLSSLWWPSGAARFAYGHFLADGDSAGRIRDAANGADGSGTAPVTLRMASNEAGDAEVLEAGLTLLRAVPLTQVPTEEGFAPNNLYLLVVVDARYHWRDAPAPDFGIAAASTAVTWSGCFAMVGSALGVSIDVDEIDPAYLYPDVSLNAPGESCAVLLDALAHNVGKRVVRKLDGRVQVQGFLTALQVRQQDDANHPDRRLRGGGDLFREAM